MPDTSKHVAVLKGGWSNEREVSLSSGAQCAEALRNAGYRITEIDVDRAV
ncbi:MAG: D-alanine--D-alanine ligase, partial [Cucumibacter sp.]